MLAANEAGLMSINETSVVKCISLHAEPKIAAHDIPILSEVIIRAKRDLVNSTFEQSFAC
jgi:hypothetical protein